MNKALKTINKYIYCGGFPPIRYTLLGSSIPFSSRWTIKQVIRLLPTPTPTPLREKENT